MIARLAPMSDSTVRSIKSSRLHEDLQPDVIGRAVFLDEAAVEGEFRVGRRGKADFDFLEAGFHERLEQLEFLADVHGHSERLVAIAQIHAAPDGRMGEDAVGPLPVGQFDRRERAIFPGRIFEHVLFQLWQWRFRLAKQKKNPTAGLAVGFVKSGDYIRTQPPGCQAAARSEAGSDLSY